ncbi:hypothetical protein EON65_47565 [archaeon]|nr:MAG: hypothetical protein EON65_47565 [archaeon]
MGDVLGAMADSLMERQPRTFQPKLKFQDNTLPTTAIVASSSVKAIAAKPAKRPPREVFYRQTSMFLTNLPKTIERHRCNVSCLCEGDLATLICHSCSVYQPSQKAFYCDKCFGRMHPWHRIPHIYTSISTNEDIELSLRISHHIAETKRYEHDSQDILKKVIVNRDVLVGMAANERTMEDKVWDYGRRMLSLEDHINALRQQLYEDMLEQSMKKPLVADEDTAKISCIKEERRRLQDKLSQVLIVRAQTPKDDTLERVSMPQAFGYYVPGAEDKDSIEGASNLVPVGISTGMVEDSSEIQENRNIDVASRISGEHNKDIDMNESSSPVEEAI